MGQTAGDYRTVSVGPVRWSTLVPWSPRSAWPRPRLLDYQQGWVHFLCVKHLVMAVSLISDGTTYTDSMALSVFNSPLIDCA